MRGVEGAPGFVGDEAGGEEEGEEGGVQGAVVGLGEVGGAGLVGAVVWPVGWGWGGVVRVAWWGGGGEGGAVDYYGLVGGGGWEEVEVDFEADGWGEGEEGGEGSGRLRWRWGFWREEGHFEGGWGWWFWWGHGWFDGDVDDGEFSGRSKWWWKRFGLKMPDGKWKGVLSRIVPGRRIAPGGPWGSYLMRPNVTWWCCRIPPKRSAAVLCLRPAALPCAKNIFAQGTGQGSKRNQHRTRIKITLNPPSLPFSFFLSQRPLWCSNSTHTPESARHVAPFGCTESPRISWPRRADAMETDRRCLLPTAKKPSGLPLPADSESRKARSAMNKLGRHGRT